MYKVLPSREFLAAPSIEEAFRGAQQRIVNVQGVRSRRGYLGLPVGRPFYEVVFTAGLVVHSEIVPVPITNSHLERPFQEATDSQHVVRRTVISGLPKVTSTSARAFQ